MMGKYCGLVSGKAPSAINPVSEGNILFRRSEVGCDGAAGTEVEIQGNLGLEISGANISKEEFFQ
ncbi:MAG: hypothetical protein NPIRA03_34620 [Nitrospirales bacterium]|nr:MAG: hypothetical protein NPIRA03_34620 [Nitrospirales bacterium]